MCDGFVIFRVKMADLNSELVLRAVNYHGKKLNSLIRETHQLLFMNVDYHLFLQVLIFSRRYLD